METYLPWIYVCLLSFSTLSILNLCHCTLFPFSFNLRQKIHMAKAELIRPISKLDLRNILGSVTEGCEEHIWSCSQNLILFAEQDSLNRKLQQSSLHLYLGISSNV